MLSCPNHELITSAPRSIRESSTRITFLINSSRYAGKSRAMLDLLSRVPVVRRYRVQVADGLRTTSRPFHLASLHFSTSNPDVLMRLAVFDDHEELVHVEGKGSVILPAVLFMRATIGGVPVEPSSRPLSRGGGAETQKKGLRHQRRGSHEELISRSATDRLMSEQREVSIHRAWQRHALQMLFLNYRDQPVTPS